MKKPSRKVRKMLDSELIDIARGHQTKAGIWKKDGHIARELIKRGIYDDACEHMIIGSYSTPQLMCKSIFEEVLKEKCVYNDRSIIPPYEIDIYFPKYRLGIEYNGDYWHNKMGRRKIDIEKRERCLEDGLTLISIEGGKKFSEEILKNEIISHLNVINYSCGLDLDKESILRANPFNFSDTYLNKDLIKRLVRDCENIKDFIKKYYALYCRLQRANKLHLLDEIRERRKEPLTKERVRYLFKKIPNKKILREDYPNLYWIAFRFGREFFEECCNHMPRYLSPKTAAKQERDNEKIRKELLKDDSLKFFAKGYKYSYELID